MEHVYELRKRLFYVAISVALFSGLAYAVEHHLVAALLAPAQGQKFIYTSPGGGIDFLFRICLYAGLACSTPVIVYQVLRYVEPLIKKGSMRFITLGSMASGVLALLGIAFGYFIGLPAALHFLLHQFVTKDVQPLLTIQSYMSFVTMYLLGSTLLFQLPLILLFINRIKPLKPQQLLRFERWIILIAFIAGGVLNPSPNISDQLLLAGPMILMYQVGIILIWAVNRKHRKSKRVVTLLQQDAEIRATRLQQVQLASSRQPVVAMQGIPVSRAVPLPAAKQTLQATAKPTHAQPVTPSRGTPAPSVRPRRYVNDFTRRPYNPIPRLPNTENAA